MLRESISVSAFLLLTLSAVSAIAQHGMMGPAPAPAADNRPGSSNLPPASSQREMYTPPGAGPTSAPAAGSVDRLGPPAISTSPEVARLQQSISANEARLDTVHD